MAGSNIDVYEHTRSWLDKYYLDYEFKRPLTYNKVTWTYWQHIHEGNEFTKLYAGTDYAATIGTALYSPVNGEKCYYMAESSNIAQITFRPYCYFEEVHLDSNIGKIYEKVDVGQHIANTGVSGTGVPHLHEGLILEGVRVDPEFFYQYYFYKMETKDLAPTWIKQTSEFSFLTFLLDNVNIYTAVFDKSGKFVTGLLDGKSASSIETLEYSGNVYQYCLNDKKLAVKRLFSKKDKKFTAWEDISKPM